MNSAQIAAAQNEPDYGSDDDGGAETPADAQSQFLTSANSNQLEINLGGSRGQPQLKETILKPLVADTISNLLIANGYDADSARMIESAAKDLPAHIQTLPPQSVAVAVGALDLAGEYRVKQIAIFENGEYVITIAAKDDGGTSRRPSRSFRRNCSTIPSGTRSSERASRSRTASIARASETACRSLSSARRSSS